MGSKLYGWTSLVRTIWKESPRIHRYPLSSSFYEGGSLSKLYQRGSHHQHDNPIYSQERVGPSKEVHIKQSKSQENKSQTKIKTNHFNIKSLKRAGSRRRSSLEIPEPALKTSHFTIGNSSRNKEISNVQIGRPKRTSQLLASAIIKMEVDESNQKRNNNRKILKTARFPENDGFIQKCIFVKQT